MSVQTEELICVISIATTLLVHMSVTVPLTNLYPQTVTGASVSTYIISYIIHFITVQVIIMILITHAI